MAVQDQDSPSAEVQVSREQGGRLDKVEQPVHVGKGEFEVLPCPLKEYRLESRKGAAVEVAAEEVDDVPQGGVDALVGVLVA